MARILLIANLIEHFRDETYYMDDLQNWVIKMSVSIIAVLNHFLGLIREVFMKVLISQLGSLYIMWDVKNKIFGKEWYHDQ